MSDQSSFRRAMYLSTGTSILVPVIGLLTAPIMTRALGVAGRGEVATATAPNSVIAIVAMLGMPEALTFLLARHPALTRRALLFASAVSTTVGLLCFAVVYVLSAVLANGDPRLAELVMLGTGLAVPSLIVNLLRGAAMGRQMWRSVAIERATNSIFRLVLISVLAAVDRLTVTSSVYILAVAPILSGAVYWNVLRQAPAALGDTSTRIAGSLMSFGPRSWIGSIASMLNGRLSQLLITPLSNVQEIGLYVVAIMISDVPLIVANAVRDVVFGTNARSTDIHRLTATVRITTFIGLLASVALGAVLPLVMVPLFGVGFEQAIIPTWILLAAGVIGVPGLITGSGLGAWGRPTFGSTVAIAGLVTNLVGLLVLVPLVGALGAALAELASTLLTSVVGVAALSRVAGVRPHDFFVLRKSDVVTTAAEGVLFLSRARAVMDRPGARRNHP